MRNGRDKSSFKSNNDAYKDKLVDYLRDYIVIQLKRYCYQNEDAKVTIIEGIYVAVKRLILDGKISNFSKIEVVVTKIIEKKKALEEHSNLEEDLTFLYLANKASKVGEVFK